MYANVRGAQSPLACGRNGYFLGAPQRNVCLHALQNAKSNIFSTVYRLSTHPFIGTHPRGYLPLFIQTDIKLFESGNIMQQI